MTEEIKLKRQDEISSKEVFYTIKRISKYLLSKWIIIVLCGILGGIVGFFYAKSKESVYIASTTFVLEDGSTSNGLGQLAGLASVAGVDLGSNGGGIFQGDNILELYKSRKMIEKTLFSKLEDNSRSELLINRYIAFNKLHEKWDTKPQLKGLRFFDATSHTRLQDSVVGEIVNDINKNYLSVTKPDKKLSIIKAVVKSPDEVFSKNFNDQIVKNVNDFYIQTKTKKSIENVTILQQKTDSVRNVMNGAIYIAASVADATPNLNPTRLAQRVAPVQKSQFSAETNKAILGALVQNLEMSKISLRKETPLIQVIDAPVYPLYKEKLGKAKGIVLGGILFGFLTVLSLIAHKVFVDVLN